MAAVTLYTRRYSPLTDFGHNQSRHIWRQYSLAEHTVRHEVSFRRPNYISKCGNFMLHQTISMGLILTIQRQKHGFMILPLECICLFLCIVVRLLSMIYTVQSLLRMFHLTECPDFFWYTTIDDRRGPSSGDAPLQRVWKSYDRVSFPAQRYAYVFRDPELQTGAVVLNHENGVSVCGEKNTSSFSVDTPERQTHFSKIVQ